MNNFLKVLFLEFVINVTAQNYNRWWLLNTKLPYDNVKMKKALNYAEDAIMNFTERAAKYGFPTETHRVITEDGYILKMFRLIQLQCKETKRPPVLLNHGAFVNSISWIDHTPDKSLAYLLVNSCYDLWLGNARGTEYSRQHMTMNPNSDPNYWQYSWHETGVYDLRSFVDYILENTNSSKVNYIGHSQAAAGFFILTSLKPEYMEKFGVTIALAPATFMKHTNSYLFRLLYGARHIIHGILNTLGVQEVTTVNSIMHVLLTYICKTARSATIVCNNFLSIIDGRHDNSIPNDTLLTLTGHVPDSVSLKTFFHFSQAMTISKFRQYDYGARINRMVYGRRVPPEYNLSNVSTPVAIMYGMNDRFINFKDIKKLRSKLSNIIDFHCMENPQWNHIDFVWSRYIPKLLFPKIDFYLSKYSFDTK